MTERTRNMIVGLTALAGIAAMGWLIVVFGEVPQWVDETYPIRVYLDDANGLATGSRVKLSGIDVGYIQSVHFQDEPGQGVVLRCAIQSQYPIPRNSEVRAQSSLLGGGAELRIVPKPVEGERAYLARDGSGELTGRATSLSRQISRLSENLSGQLEQQLENFGTLSQKMAEMSEQYTEVGKRISAMLEPRSLKAVDRGEVPGNLRTAIARADARLAEMGNTLTEINKLVGDEQLRSDLRAAASNAREFTADAKKFTGDARKQLNRLVGRYVAVADDLSKTVSRVDAVLADIQEGKGTIGRLARDPALYNSITDAANRLSDLVEETKLLIQKWKAEGIPVQF